MIDKDFPDVKFNKLNEINESLLKRVVVVSKYKDKWVFCKHKERGTWEIPGGKIEVNEKPLDAAKRELYEETGAKKFEIKPICIYTIFKPGLLCYATINDFEDLPEYEIEEIDFFDDIPTNLSYSKVHPKLFAKVKEEIEKIL